MLPPRGYLFIGLNVIRILSIVSLILVFASNIEILVRDILAVNHFGADGKGMDTVATNASLPQMENYAYIPGSTVPIQPAGVFWAVLNRLLIIGQTIVLVLSEFGWPSVFFERFFPVLGKEFGLGPLGLIQSLIGAAVLSHHVNIFALVSAFLVFSVGCLNILLGLIFGPSARAKRSVTSWGDQSGPSLPTYASRSMTSGGTGPLVSPSSFLSSVMLENATASPNASPSIPNKTGMGFGRQAEKAAAAKGYLISKPLESLPKFARVVPGGTEPVS